MRNTKSHGSCSSILPELITNRDKGKQMQYINQSRMLLEPCEKKLANYYQTLLINLAILKARTRLESRHHEKLQFIKRKIIDVSSLGAIPPCIATYLLKQCDLSGV